MEPTDVAPISIKRMVPNFSVSISVIILLFSARIESRFLSAIGLTEYRAPLIKRALDGENPFVVWGDGSAVRDFIHARDVARGMMLALEKGLGQPINLGSGEGVSIKKLVEIVVSNMKTKPEVVWDTSKPTGDKKRLMDITRAKTLLGFEPAVSIEDGIKEVMEWYEGNKDIADKRYNVFTENK